MFSRLFQELRELNVKLCLLHELLYESLRTKLFISHNGKVNFRMNLADNQKATLTLSAQDAAGRPAAIVGTPAWSVDKPNIITLTASTDGLSAEVQANTDLGSAVVTAQVDGLTAFDTIVVTGGPAVSLSIVEGAPGPV